MELSSALAPVRAVPLAEDEGGATVVVDPRLEAQGQLPAHVGLPVDGPFTGLECSGVERAPHPAREVGRVVEDADAVVGAGDPLAVVVLHDRTAELPGEAAPLPLVGTQAGDVAPDPHPIGGIG